ncbi:hypothetical protein H696_04873 [Fonticula alba]|uniref:Calcineurin-like phosphoesterase domain-containing protein n=1 Tax=Fonticula alba TaxID=691883 RepID=A0A058Z2S7_FONAL|nr:hypothetical protein H696_04873 [Fonticula alba]KCV68579.1 hypothetical protein H696_04873 [Fonticula alba]|eukprot:XP_009497011.1 hypothetical protein H696_04873 [Fonticula alba]
MRHFLIVALIAALLGPALALGPACQRSADAPVFTGEPSWPSPMKANLTIALLGDVAMRNESVLVFDLIKRRGADFAIHAGDFDYDNDPESWEQFIDRELGEYYPYFAVIGNHDQLRWSGYEKGIVNRMRRLGADNHCKGVPGISTVCNWEGFLFAMSGVGCRLGDHEEFLEEALGSYANPWKLCTWHKNQRMYQIGGKLSTTGYGVYDACRRAGALIHTGHEHSYSRTHLMSNFEKYAVASTDRDIHLSAGRTIAWVSGLGGRGVRDWNEDLVSNPWWAAVGASNNGIQEGALFCTFNIHGDPRRAFCEFEDIAGRIWDQFQVFSHVDPHGVPAPQSRLEEELETRNRGDDLCRTRQFEVQVMRQKDNYIFDRASGTRVLTRDAALTVDENQSVRLIFRDLPAEIPAGDLLSAHIQLLGLESDQHELPLLRIGSPVGAAEPVAWSYEDEEWEASTVWTTPDLIDIVRDAYIAAEGGIIGPSVTVDISSVFGRRSFAAFEPDMCLAASLYVEYRSC